MGLDAIARELNLPPKGTEVVNAKGKRYHEFTEQELEDYGDYCKHDVNLCHYIYNVLWALYERHNKQLA